MTRREALVAAWSGAAAVAVVGVAGCASGTQVTPAIVSQDVVLIANGLTAALAKVSLPGVVIPPAVDTALADLQAAAAAVGQADTIAQAQPIVLRVETDLNAFVAAGAALPSPVQPYLAAAMVLLPVIEAAVNLVVPAKAAPAAMTPAQARAVLRAA